MTEISFCTMLSRYFFFSWLFKDVLHGNRFERAAGWKYNLEQSHWLRTYLRRWACMAAIMFILGLVCEQLLRAPAFSAFFYVPSVLSLSINSVIGALMIGFTAMHRQR